MAFLYVGKITLIDEQGLKTTLTYDLGTTVGADVTTEFGPVWDELADIAAALDAITTANLFQVAMTFRDDALEDASLPTEAEVPEEAAVAVHVAADPLPEKLAYIRIPAPIDGLFLADGRTLDTNNTDLQDYVAELSANVEISDGESIITARGAAGIKLGYLRFKSRSARVS